MSTTGVDFDRIAARYKQAVMAAESAFESQDALAALALLEDAEEDLRKEGLYSYAEREFVTRHAFYRERMGDFDGARQLYERALALGPGQPGVTSLGHSSPVQLNRDIAWCLQKLSRLDEARQLLETVLQNAPSPADADVFLLLQQYDGLLRAASEHPPATLLPTLRRIWVDTMGTFLVPPLPDDTPSDGWLSILLRTHGEAVSRFQALLADLDGAECDAERKHALERFLAAEPNLVMRRQAHSMLEGLGS